MIDSLRNMIERRRQQTLRPFYLIVDSQLTVREAEGDGAYFGFGVPTPGRSVADDLLFLQGNDGSTDPYRVLECVETPSNRIADIHVVAMAGDWGLAYFDATEKHQRQQLEQQASNELALLQHRQEQLLSKLRQTQTSLAEANRLQGLFIARMSHEFRTPLSSVLGYADLLTETLSDDLDSLRQLGAIKRGANHLLNLVENLLDQARIEQDEVVLYPSHIDVRSMLGQLTEMFQPIADQKRLTLTGAVSDTLPEKVWVDELRLKQVLINLIGNALKFTSRGQVRIGIDWRDDRLSVEVTDTGPGISEALRQHLFEPFRRGGEGGKGAGLGLSISRTLARLMGGDLQYFYPDPPGTGMRLSIAAPPPTTPGAAPSDKLPLRDILVLVVDDDNDLLQLARVLLTRAGAIVITATTGNEAVELLELHDPDILLVDMHLEHEHGERAITRCREGGYANPAILMSASSDIKTLTGIARMTDVAFVSKPLNRDELVALIDQLHNARRVPAHS